MKKLAKIFPFLLASIFYLSACIAQEISLREQADNYCQAYNPNRFSVEEKRSIETDGQSQSVIMRINKAAQALQVKKIIEKVYSSEYEYKFFEGFQIFISKKLGKQWSCPYFPVIFEVESLENGLKHQSGLKLLPLSIGKLQPFDAQDKTADRIIVSIDKDNNIFVGDDKLTSTDVEIISKGMDKRATDINTKIVINTDGEASAQMVLSVIMAAKKSGYKQISFIVQ